MHVFFKDFLFFYSFCSSLFVFHLSIRTETGGVDMKNADRCGQGEGGAENWQKGGTLSMDDSLWNSLCHMIVKTTDQSSVSMKQ